MLTDANGEVRKGIEVAYTDEDYFTADGKFVRDVARCVEMGWPFDPEEETVRDLMLAGF